MGLILTALTDALATFRLTRLVTKDTITAEQRERFIRHEYALAGDMVAAEQHLNREPAAGGGWAEQVAADGPRAPKLAKLVTCSWCTSMWVAAGVVLARRFAPRAWQPAARVLALSAAAGLLALREEQPASVELTSVLEPYTAGSVVESFHWPDTMARAEKGADHERPEREQPLYADEVVTRLPPRPAEPDCTDECSEGHTYSAGCLLEP